MRLRLSVTLMLLLSAALLGAGIPLANAARTAYTRETFVDRLNDTARFASIAAQANQSVTSTAAEINEYEAVYGIGVIELDTAGHSRLKTRNAVLPIDAETRLSVSDALSGRRSDSAPTRWPWDSRPLVIAEPITRGGDVIGAIVTISPTARLRARVLSTWAVLALLGFLLLLICYVAASRLARWILRPIGELATVTSAVSTGRLAARVPAGTGPPELRRLAMSFNTMADNVQSSLEQQRAFVADASHQLRNPLAALLIRLDDVADRAEPELREEALRVLDDAHHLAALVDRLLDLAVSEQAEVTARPGSVTIAVADRIAAWQPVARQRGISIRHDARLWATGLVDVAVLDDVLDVVLDNAVKFSPDAGTVAVAIYREADKLVVSVRDHGPGISTDELTRIGHRFWRSRAVQNVPGFGLGLSIATALLGPAGGRLEFTRPDGDGLTVRIALPVLPVIPVLPYSALGAAIPAQRARV